LTLRTLDDGFGFGRGRAGGRDVVWGGGGEGDVWLLLVSVWLLLLFGFLELFLLLLAFCKFLALGDARDEVDEAVAVTIGWDGGDLRVRVTEAFPEVFYAFDRAVLNPN
jgi:hypothetical protein